MVGWAKSELKKKRDAMKMNRLFMMNEFKPNLVLIVEFTFWFVNTLRSDLLDLQSKWKTWWQNGRFPNLNSVTLFASVIEVLFTKTIEL